MASWAALLEGVPTVFLSGDRALCEDDQDLFPKMVTVPVKEGIGNSTLSNNPKDMVQAIRDGVEKALKIDHKKDMPKLPEEFVLEVCYKDPPNAYMYSFYPGVKMKDANTLVFQTDAYFELLRAYRFMK